MLLTNGCSFVWGDELPGCYENPPNHFQHTFTSHLGNHLGLNSVILGACGAGNDYIFRTTIEWLADKTKPQPTHMVILWTAWQREENLDARIIDLGRDRQEVQLQADMVQFSEERVHNLHPSRQGAAFRYYNDVYDSGVSVLYTVSKMIAIQTICEERGIKLLQGVFHERCFNNMKHQLKRGRVPQYKKELKKQIRLLNKTSRIGLGAYQDFYSMARENNDVMKYSHPGLKTHLRYAKYLYKIYRET